MGGATAAPHFASVGVNVGDARAQTLLQSVKTKEMRDPLEAVQAILNQNRWVPREKRGGDGREGDRGRERERGGVPRAPPPAHTAAARSSPRSSPPPGMSLETVEVSGGPTPKHVN